MSSSIYLIIVTVVLLVVLLIVFTIYFALKDLKEKELSGREALEGEIGVARTDLNPEGRVLVHGEWWNARADENLPEGTKVKVIKTQKMMLRVVRAPEEE